MASKNTVKEWFRTKLKPTQNQFWTFFDSIFWKDEKIPITAIEDIEDVLNNKADRKALENHLSDPNAHIELMEGKLDKDGYDGTAKNLDDDRIAADLLKEDSVNKSTSIDDILSTVKFPVWRVISDWSNSKFITLSTDQSINGIKTFLSGKLGLRNIANTFTSFFTNSNTASRTYTLKDRSGTLLDDTDFNNLNASLATKQSVFSGVQNYITKSLTSTSLGVSRLRDNGIFFGIDTVYEPTKDITLSNKNDTEIGVEQSESTRAGKDLILSAGRTVNYSLSSDFVSLNQPSLDWGGVFADRNNNIWACNANGGAHKRTNGIGNFDFYSTVPGAFPRAIVVSPVTGDIYVNTFAGTGAIQMQAGGSGLWENVFVTNAWTVLAALPNGDVYAAIDGGLIYKRTGGVGAFVNIGEPARRYTGICSSLNGDLYFTVANVGIYKKTGSGSLVLISSIAAYWSGITISDNNNIYACIAGGDIFVQVNATGSFLSLNQVSRNWNGITADIYNNVYAIVKDGGIYYLNTTSLGTANLDGGTAKLKAGTAKGTGKSRVEFWTGQKRVSGTDMQIDTLRSFIDENGYMVWVNMPICETNVAAIDAGLPIGAEYRTATGERRIVY